MDQTILLPSTVHHTYTDCSCNGTWWRMHLLSIPVPFIMWEYVAFQIKSGFSSHKMSWESTMSTLIFQENQLQKVASKLIYRLQVVHHWWFVQQNPWIFVALRMDTSNTQVSCETKLLFWSQSVCKYYAEFLIGAHTLVDVSSCRQKTASPAIFCTILTSTVFSDR